MGKPKVKHARGATVDRTKCGIAYTVVNGQAVTDRGLTPITVLKDARRATCGRCRT